MEMEMEVGAWDTALAGRARPGGVRIAADRLGAASRGTLGNDHRSAMMEHIPQLPGCVVRGGVQPAQPPGAPRVSTSGSREPEFRRGWHRLQPP